MDNLIFLMRMFERRVGGGESYQMVKKWIEENGGDLSKDPFSN